MLNSCITCGKQRYRLLIRALQTELNISAVNWIGSIAAEDGI